MSWLLLILLFLPLVGALAVLATPHARAARCVTLVTALATFGLSLALLIPFFNSQPAAATAQTYTYSVTNGVGTILQGVNAEWIPAFNIHFRLGFDGLSLPLIILTTLITVLACIGSWNVDRMTRGYLSLLLLLLTGILGVFLSLDLFLFYVFFELSLVPMYFLIGIWGGPRREYAAIKFFLYTLVGSIALLIVLIAVYLYTGSFDLIALASPELQALIPQQPARILFWLAMLSFLIKLPAVPLHTWLPDAHVEAPTPMSMILAALLLKMGGYGILRVAYPIFPDAAREFWLIIAVIGVVAILYGACCALAQTDFKRLVAYSSVSHMGLVILGIAVMTPAALHGAIFMMLAHGITSAMMFFVVGVIYDRAHHRDLGRLGGFASTMPVYAGLSAVAAFASLGLPGLCGFIGEVLVILGTFDGANSQGVIRLASGASATPFYVMGVLACLGIILTAAYMLWMMQRVFFGAIRPEYKSFPDADLRERLVLWPLAILALLLGILPNVFVFPITNATVKALMGLLS